MAASGIQIIVKIKDLRSWFGVDFDVLLQSIWLDILGKMTVLISSDSKKLR